MKKNRIMKGILLLIVLAVLAIGFTGCGTTIITTTPATGTVTIVLAGDWEYHLYMDYNLLFEEDDPVESGQGSIYLVPAGYHFFQAVDTWGASYGYDSVTQYIFAGITNYVYLYP